MHTPTQCGPKVRLPEVIGSYHHSPGPYRTRRCLSLDEFEPLDSAIASVDADGCDALDFAIVPLRRSAAPNWLLEVLSDLRKDPSWTVRHGLD